MRRVAEEADAGKAYEAQLEALKAQRDADKAEAIKEREASRAAYFVELEQASKKVEALEAKLMQADQALQDAQEREAQQHSSKVQVHLGAVQSHLREARLHP